MSVALVREDMDGEARSLLVEGLVDGGGCARSLYRVDLGGDAQLSGAKQ